MLLVRLCGTSETVAGGAGEAPAGQLGQCFRVAVFGFGGKMSERVRGKRQGRLSEVAAAGCGRWRWPRGRGLRCPHGFRRGSGLRSRWYGQRGLSGFELFHGSAEGCPLGFHVERLRDAVGNGGSAGGSRWDFGFNFY